ncbi:hypothetical protein [Halomonas sp. ML-15]|nr:hypothetical protein [Halomonas sp. ML-15]
MMTSNTRFSLIKGAGQVAYRLLERMSERSYRAYRVQLATRYGI